MAEIIYRKDPTKQELKWEKMKDTLEARRKRILDPRVGDVTYRKEDLDRHYLEKKQREDEEKKQSIAEGKVFRQLDNLHKHQCFIDRQSRLNTSKNEVAFRQEQQLPQQRRDYDLYDRHKWKSDRVPTFQDPDMQGPAAMLNFDSFKLGNPEIEPERRRYQRGMLDLQVEANEKRREKDEKISTLQKEIEITIGNKAEDDHRRVMAMRRADNVKCAEENKRAVADKSDRRQVLKNDEMKANQDEINFWTAGELLDAKPDKYDRHRRIHWRGHTKEERLQNFKAPLTGVVSQVKEKDLKKLRDSQAERKEVDDANKSQCYAKLLDMNDKLRNINLHRAIQAENMFFGEENRKKKEHLAHEVYGANKPTDAFWNQFGISGR